MVLRKTLYHLLQQSHGGKHIHKVAEAEVPDQAAHDNQLLFNEPDYLKIGDNRDAKLINNDGLPDRPKATFKQGVYY